MIDYKFSVLIPVYIKENPRYLFESLESLIHQTLLPNEIVLVEDGALTNELYDIIDTFTNKYKELFTIVKIAKNSGMGVAMNTGLKVCKYEWVARMDSDDVCVNTRFEQQIDFLKKNPSIDVIGSNIEEFVNSVGDLNQRRTVPEKHEEILHFSKFRNPMNHMTVIFKKSKALAVGGYWHHRVLEDYHLWFMMLNSNCVFYNLQEALVYARIGNNMLGRRKGWSYLKMEFKFFYKMKRSAFITNVQMYKAISSRVIMKILPSKILLVAYRLILRKGN